ncbi:MAG: protoporphyrinogen IX oxidase [Flavobacteriales bacterium CG11_big_fil_rev_8_21_14_0_20_35_7]|nr:MAG: protoporphyrinogen IX oxidase [Flavobacteriales bacterium CG11_big_fil_rev_8_21_14_0_20_35_7]
MDYLYLKSLHIIFVTTWFAGLFYIIRLFIYFKEAEENPELESTILRKQYLLMSKRLLYMITWPSAILASVFAFWMLYEVPAYLTQGWMLIKLGFVLALYIYHYSCQLIYNQMSHGEIKFSAFGLRIWNEVATIILFACVFLVVLKNSIGWIFGLVGIVGVSILLMMGIKIYKNIRAKNSWDSSIK